MRKQHFATASGGIVAEPNPRNIPRLLRGSAVLGSARKRPNGTQVVLNVVLDRSKLKTMLINLYA
jgi:hypothetical protein